MQRVNGDCGAEIMLANWLLEEAGIPATNSDRLLVAQCIKLLAKQGGDLKTAAEFILHAAQQTELQGEVINRWYFQDRKYLPRKGPSNPGVWDGKASPSQTLRSLVSEAYWLKTVTAFEAGDALGEFDLQLMKEAGRVR